LVYLKSSKRPDALSSLVIMASAGEDFIEGVNHLANLYLRAFYGFSYLAELLKHDDYMHEFSDRFATGSRVAKVNAQIMVDHLHKKRERFVFMEAPRMTDFNMKRAAELDRSIHWCVRRLEKLAERQQDLELAQLLKARIGGWRHSPNIRSPKIFRLETTESTTLEYEEERKEVYWGREDSEKSSSADSKEDRYALLRSVKDFLGEDRDGSGKETTLQDGDKLLSVVEGACDGICGNIHLPCDEARPLTTTCGNLPSFPGPPVVANDEYRNVESDQKGQAEKEEGECDGICGNIHVFSNETRLVNTIANNSDDKQPPIEPSHAVDPDEEDDADGGHEGQGEEENKFTNGMTLDHKQMEVAMELKLKWKKVPKNVLVVRKLMAPDLHASFILIVEWLNAKGTTIFVETPVVEEPSFAAHPGADKIKEICQILEKGEDVEEKDIDLVVAFGGDGTLLHASSLFPNDMPPVAGFRTGTLNFLVPFKFEMETTQKIIDSILSGCAMVNLRSRINCIVKDKNGAVTRQHTALNEIAVTRGAAPQLCKLNVYVNGQKLAKVEGDGLLLSTPTGSTAYSLAAGGAVLHPAVPCLQLVPIAPHSICSRAIVLPASSEVIFRLTKDARADATISSDGMEVAKLTKENTLTMTTSDSPLPICCGVPSDVATDSGWLKTIHWCKKMEAPQVDEDLILPTCNCG